MKDICLQDAIAEHSLLAGRSQHTFSNEEIHIGYGTNDHYARCVGASIASLCLNNREANLVFHVLASELKQESMLRFKQLAEDFEVVIHVYAINNQIFAPLPVQAHFPAAIYYRMILPDILSTPKVLYLDADIICLKNIQEFFSMDMQNYIIAAVPDLEEFGNKRNRVLGLNNHIYFNSGVLLVDIKEWNQYDVSKKSLALLMKEPKKFRYPDQDVLNVVLTNKVKYLGKEWNRINTPQMLADDGIKFLHFAAHPKPWSIAWDKSNLCNDFTRNIYNNYENLSPWKNSGPTEPRNYKEMKKYAQCLFKAGEHSAGFYWYGQYIKAKFNFKLCR